MRRARAAAARRGEARRAGAAGPVHDAPATTIARDHAAERRSRARARRARDLARRRSRRLEREPGRALIAACPTASSRAPPASSRRRRPPARACSVSASSSASRDALADRLATARRRGRADRRAGRGACVARRAARAPERHRWARVDEADLGRAGLQRLAVRPRLGLIGMLMGWWHVKLSSGCPLAG